LANIAAIGKGAMGIMRDTFLESAKEKMPVTTALADLAKEEMSSMTKMAGATTKKIYNTYKNRNSLIKNFFNQLADEEDSIDGGNTESMEFEGSTSSGTPSVEETTAKAEITESQRSTRDLRKTMMFTATKQLEMMVASTATMTVSFNEMNAELKTVNTNLGSILEVMKKGFASSIKQEEEKKLREISNAYDSAGNLTVSGYSKQVRENLKDTPLSNIKSAGEMLKMMTNDPQMLLSMVFGGIFGNNKLAINRLMTGVESMVSKSFASVVERISSDEFANRNQLTSFISDKFGMKNTGKVDNINIHKGITEQANVAFDNITRKTIVDVIPGYLSRILEQNEKTVSALVQGLSITDASTVRSTGTMYDMTSGKFSTKQQIKSTFTRRFTDAIDTSIIRDKELNEMSPQEKEAYRNMILGMIISNYDLNRIKNEPIENLAHYVSMGMGRSSANAKSTLPYILKFYNLLNSPDTATKTLNDFKRAYTSARKEINEKVQLVNVEQFGMSDSLADYNGRNVAEIVTGINAKKDRYGYYENNVYKSDLLGLENGAVDKLDFNNRGTRDRTGLKFLKQAGTYAGMLFGDDPLLKPLAWVARKLGWKGTDKTSDEYNALTGVDKENQLEEVLRTGAANVGTKLEGTGFANEHQGIVNTFTKLGNMSDLASHQGSIYTRDDKTHEMLTWFFDAFGKYAEVVTDGKVKIDVPSKWAIDTAHERTHVQFGSGSSDINTNTPPAGTVNIVSVNTEEIAPEDRGEKSQVLQDEDAKSKGKPPKLSDDPALKNMFGVIDGNAFKTDSKDIFSKIANSVGYAKRNKGKVAAAGILGLMTGNPLIAAAAMSAVSAVGESLETSADAEEWNAQQEIKKVKQNRKRNYDVDLARRELNKMLEVSDITKEQYDAANISIREGGDPNSIVDQLEKQQRAFRKKHRFELADDKDNVKFEEYRAKIEELAKTPNPETGLPYIDEDTKYQLLADLRTQRGFQRVAKGVDTFLKSPLYVTKKLIIDLPKLILKGTFKATKALISLPFKLIGFGAKSIRNAINAVADKLSKNAEFDDPVYVEEYRESKLKEIADTLSKNTGKPVSVEEIDDSAEGRQAKAELEETITAILRKRKLGRGVRKLDEVIRNFSSGRWGRRRVNNATYNIETLTQQMQKGLDNNANNPAAEVSPEVIKESTEDGMRNALNENEDLHKLGDAAEHMIQPASVYFRDEKMYEMMSWFQGAAISIMRSMGFSISAPTSYSSDSLHNSHGGASAVSYNVPIFGMSTNRERETTAVITESPASTQSSDVSTASFFEGIGSIGAADTNDGKLSSDEVSAMDLQDNAKEGKLHGTAKAILAMDEKEQKEKEDEEVKENMDSQSKLFGNILSKGSGALSRIMGFIGDSKVLTGLGMGAAVVTGASILDGLGLTEPLTDWMTNTAIPAIGATLEDHIIPGAERTIEWVSQNSERIFAPVVKMLDAVLFGGDGVGGRKGLPATIWDAIPSWLQVALVGLAAAKGINAVTSTVESVSNIATTIAGFAGTTATTAATLGSGGSISAAAGAGIAAAGAGTAAAIALPIAAAAITAGIAIHEVATKEKDKDKWAEYATVKDANGNPVTISKTQWDNQSYDADLLSPSNPNYKDNMVALDTAGFGFQTGDTVFKPGITNSDLGDYSRSVTKDNSKMYSSWKEIIDPSVIGSITPVTKFAGAWDFSGLSNEKTLRGAADIAKYGDIVINGAKGEKMKWSDIVNKANGGGFSQSELLDILKQANNIGVDLDDILDLAYKNGIVMSNSGNVMSNSGAGKNRLYLKSEITSDRAAANPDRQNMYKKMFIYAAKKRGYVDPDVGYIYDPTKETLHTEMSDEQISEVWSDVVALADTKPDNVITAMTESEYNRMGRGRKRGRGSLYQEDPMYKNSPFDMYDSGCGPISLASAMQTMGANVDPMSAAAMLTGQGWRAPDGGTDPNGIVAVGNQLGGNFAQGSTNKSDIYQYVSGNAPVVMMGEGGAFGDGEHYMTAVGSDQSGNMLVRDPLSPNIRTVSPSQLGNIDAAIYGMGHGRRGRGTLEDATASLGNNAEKLVNYIKGVGGKVSAFTEQISTNVIDPIKKALMKLFGMDPEEDEVSSAVSVAGGSAYQASRLAQQKLATGLIGLTEASIKNIVSHLSSEELNRFYAAAQRAGIVKEQTGMYQGVQFTQTLNITTKLPDIISFFTRKNKESIRAALGIYLATMGESRGLLYTAALQERFNVPYSPPASGAPDQGEVLLDKMTDFILGGTTEAVKLHTKSMLLLVPKKSQIDFINAFISKYGISSAVWTQGGDYAAINAIVSKVTADNIYKTPDQQAYTSSASIPAGTIRLNDDGSINPDILYNQLLAAAPSSDGLLSVTDKGVRVTVAPYKSGGPAPGDYTERAVDLRGTSDRTKTFAELFGRAAFRDWQYHHILPSQTLRQGALESTWGSSTPYIVSQNMFGIKANVAGMSSDPTNETQSSEEDNYKGFADVADSIYNYGEYFARQDERGAVTHRSIGQLEYDAALAGLRNENGLITYGGNTYDPDSYVRAVSSESFPRTGVARHMRQYDAALYQYLLNVITSTATVGQKREMLTNYGAYLDSSAFKPSSTSPTNALLNSLLGRGRKKGRGTESYFGNMNAALAPLQARVASATSYINGIASNPQLDAVRTTIGNISTQFANAFNGQAVDTSAFNFSIPTSQSSSANTTPSTSQPAPTAVVAARPAKGKYVEQGIQNIDQFFTTWLNATMTSGYNTTDNKTRIHHGIDYGTAGQIGAPIPSPVDGTVYDVRTDSTKAAGFAIIIRDNKYGYYHWFMHLMAAPTLAKGMSIKRGDTVGYVGNTGSVSGSIGPYYGAHLHYEIRKDNPSDRKYSINPHTFDYAAYIPAQFLKTGSGRKAEVRTTRTVNKQPQSYGRGNTSSAHPVSAQAQPVQTLTRPTPRYDTTPLPSSNTGLGKGPAPQITQDMLPIVIDQLSVMLQELQAINSNTSEANTLTQKYHVQTGNGKGSNTTRPATSPYLPSTTSTTARRQPSALNPAYGRMVKG
jgi:flagellum-specific peptidoglycan hydrolase FlgJ